MSLNAFVVKSARDMYIDGSTVLLPLLPLALLPLITAHMYQDMCHLSTTQADVTAQPWMSP